MKFQETEGKNTEKKKNKDQGGGNTHRTKDDRKNRERTKKLGGERNKHR